MRGGRPGGLQCCRDHTRCATFQEYSCSCLLIWKLAFLAHGAGRRNGTLVQRMFHCLGDAIGVTDAKPSCYCSLKAYWKSNGLTVPCKLTRPHSASIARWLVSYKLRWSATMIDFVDRQVFTQLGHQATSNQHVAALNAARIG